MYRRLIILSVFVLSLVMGFYSCQDQQGKDFDNYYTNGMNIYKAKCQNCHGANGEGLGQLSPPLTDTVYLKENKSKLACIIKNGMSEEIVINGKPFKEKMPASPDMPDMDIAQVIVYITNSFGNKQGLYVYPKVSEDLKACK